MINRCRRRILVPFLIFVGLIYPNIASAAPIKRASEFCINVLKLIAKGHYSDFSELVANESLEGKFGKTPMVDFDPINLALGKNPVLTENDIRVLKDLSPALRGKLITKYTEYFTIDQLSMMPRERWFATIDQDLKNVLALHLAVSTQITKFNAMAEAARFYDASLKNKYSADFSTENPAIFNDPELALVLNRSLQRGHGIIYNFIQNHGEIISPSIFISEEIDSYDHANGYFKFRDRTQSHEKREDYVRDLTRSTEINNAYIEFLLNHFSDKLSADQFLSLVERYQVRKRRLYDPIFRTIQSTPFFILFRPESWSFYAEILKLSKSKLTPAQQEDLSGSFKIDLRRLAIGGEQYDQFYKNVGILNRQNFSPQTSIYIAGAEGERYNDLIAKVKTYADAP